MRIQVVSALILLLAPTARAQAVPAGWKTVKDAKNICQIAVPPEWTPWTDSAGAAVFRDPSIAIAVVTNQPGQAFKPLTESMLRLTGIRKEKLFENTTKRLFFQDRTSANTEEPNAYSGSVPAESGTCSCRVVFQKTIDQETVKKIVLSLGPASGS